jgi:hypothetical protein
MAARNHIGGDECVCAKCERNEAVFMLGAILVCVACFAAVGVFFFWNLWLAIT